MIQQILMGIAALGGLAGMGSLLQVRPNARKLRADAAAVLTDSSGRLLAEALKRIDDQGAAIERLEEQLADRERQQNAQDRRLIRHERWDIAIAEQVRQLGGQVGDPPPLFHDATA